MNAASTVAGERRMSWWRRKPRAAKTPMVVSARLRVRRNVTVAVVTFGVLFAGGRLLAAGGAFSPAALILLTVVVFLAAVGGGALLVMRRMARCVCSASSCSGCGGTK